MYLENVVEVIDLGALNSFESSHKIINSIFQYFVCQIVNESTISQRTVVLLYTIRVIRL